MREDLLYCLGERDACKGLWKDRMGRGIYMDPLLKYIEKEWAVLSQAPLVFVLTFVFAVVVAVGIANWVYSRQIETLNERLRAKDDQLVDYRERLRLAPTDQTSYSRLSNAELTQRALVVVARMREFLANYDRQSRLALANQFEEMRNAKTDEERHAVWTRQTAALIRESSTATIDYDRQFKTDTIVLRDELQSRLPLSARAQRPGVSYEYPTNPIGMGMVADDVERLAKLLP